MRSAAAAALALLLAAAAAPAHAQLGLGDPVGVLPPRLDLERGAQMLRGPLQALAPPSEQVRLAAQLGTEAVWAMRRAPDAVGVVGRAFRDALLGALPATERRTQLENLSIAELHELGHGQLRLLEAVLQTSNPELVNLYYRAVMGLSSAPLCSSHVWSALAQRLLSTLPQASWAERQHWQVCGLRAALSQLEPCALDLAPRQRHWPVSWPLADSYSPQYRAFLHSIDC